MKYYFDYAAATPLSEAALKAMQPFFSDRFYNPSALYLASHDVKASIGEHRMDVARVLGCKPSEIIFTAGGTESDNLAVSGVMQAYPGKKCVISAVEHDAVIMPANQYEHKIAPVNGDGLIDLGQLEELIDEDTVLVSIMYANNEIGTIQPLREVSALLGRLRDQRQASGNKLPLYFHTDAAQAANYLPLLTNSLGVDLMSLNGGKIYGPKQSGILFIKTGTNLSPQILGGGQERNLRSGTENVAAIAGFSTALRQASEMRLKESERLTELRDNCISLLKKSLPEAKVNGTLKHRLPNNINITIDGVDNERLIMELDERGIMVASGSACSASSDTPSHVLAAIGLNETEARSSLRITLGRGTDNSQINKLVDSLSELVANSSGKR